MLDTIFLQLYDMSKIASIVILAVLLVRLCLKRAPKGFSYALWAVVLFRLLCPVSIEAPVSLIPRTEPTVASYDLLNEPITPIAAMDAAGQAVGDVLNGGIGIQHVVTENFAEDGLHRVISTDWNTVWILFTKFVWLGGLTAMLLYSTVSLVRLKRRLMGAVLLRENIYLADHIDSPFVMGLIRPKIYLPSSLMEKERDYIILHEQHHIRRWDHVIKLLSFAALCLHCFNPLVWVAFIYSGKDMEMSCDEAVLRKMGEDIRVDYSASLISLATGRRILAGTLLAFGEGDTVGRVKNIARWKKPALWVIVTAVIVCIVLAVCLATNPMSRDTMLLGAEYRVAETLYRTSDQTDYKDEDTSRFCITADYGLWERNEDGDYAFIGQMEPYTLNLKELKQYTAWDDGWLRKYKTAEITDSYILHLPENEYEGWMYVAFRTKKGDVLLGWGWEDLSERGQGPSDDSKFLWLYRLESAFGKKTSTGSFLDRSLAASVGGDVDIFHTWSNANKPGYLIVGFESDDSPYQDGTQIPSPEKTDMGFAVFYHNQNESGYRLLQCHVYEDAARTENGVYYCPDLAVLDLAGERKPDVTYDVVLVNNDEIDEATRIWYYADGTTKKQGEPNVNGRQMLLYSWEYKRTGCRIWQYFYGANGELIDSNNIGSGSTTLVRTWVDYYRMPNSDTMDRDQPKEITLPDFPDVTFVYTDEAITAVKGNEITQLIYGMPIWNVFFSDLNGDGYSEICASVSYGSGIIDTHVVVYDYKAGKEYTLWERGVYDYVLRVVNGQFVCAKCEYPAGEVTDYGPIVIENGKLKMVSGIVEMTPTQARVKGAYDGFLYVPRNGKNYRYERFDIVTDPSVVTKGELIYTFTEEADPQNVDWWVYAVEEYPDQSVVLAETGNDYVQLYRYSPSKAVNPEMLKVVKAAGMVVEENGEGTFGQELWQTFYEKTQRGEPASVQIARWYTMDDPSRYAEIYYEVHKEDYPALYIMNLSYDGEYYYFYHDGENPNYLKRYEYLMRYEDRVPKNVSPTKQRTKVYYTLTHDDEVTWNELQWGIFSSRLGDYIDHYTVYSDYADGE